MGVRSDFDEYLAEAESANLKNETSKTIKMRKMKCERFGSVEWRISPWGFLLVG